MRLQIFLTVLFSFTILETLFQRRPSDFRFKRRAVNIMMTLPAQLLLKLLMPAGLAYFCLLAEKKSWGLFNLFHISDFKIELILSLIILDLCIYLQHIASHRWAWFWKFHRVHHSDFFLDSSSALRFHPVEILISFAYKILLVFILGLDLTAVFWFEVLLNAFAIFTHSNLYLPKILDQTLQKVFVTPDMHRIHHSTELEDHDTNFGFNLSIWDRALKTFTHSRFKNESDTVVGLEGKEFQTQNFWKLLKMPWQ